MCRIMVDYILIRKSESKLIRDVKVIWQEQCVPNHKLIICVLNLKESLDKWKMGVVKRCICCSRMQAKLVPCGWPMYVMLW